MFCLGCVKIRNCLWPRALCYNNFFSKMEHLLNYFYPYTQDALLLGPPLRDLPRPDQRRLREDGRRRVLHRGGRAHLLRRQTRKINISKKLHFNFELWEMCCLYIAEGAHKVREPPRVPHRAGGRAAGAPGSQVRREWKLGVVWFHFRFLWERKYKRTMHCTLNYLHYWQHDCRLDSSLRL